MTDVKKLESYENFVNDVLKKDLECDLNERDKIYEELAQHFQLKQSINCLLKFPSKEGLRCQVDIGSNFYVQAQVDDFSRIFVNIGLGFYAEMSLDEALKYVEKKIELLNEKVKESTSRITKIKAKIKFVCESLRELQEL